MTEKRNAEENTRKLIEYISSHENEEVRLSNKDVLSILGYAFISPSVIRARQAIPFHGEPIIPEYKATDKARRAKRTVYYTMLSKEDYEKYDFTQDNFKFLTSHEIKEIEKKTGPMPKSLLFRLLSICDIILLKAPDGSFYTVNERTLSSVLFQPIKETRIQLEKLVTAGILEQAGESFAFVMRRSYKTFDNASEKSIIGFDKIKTYLPSLGALVEECQKLGDAYATLKMKYDKLFREHAEYNKDSEERKKAFELVNKNRTELFEENKKLKEKIETYADNVKDYVAFKKRMHERIDSVMDHFVDKSTKCAVSFTENQNSGRFFVQMQELTKDVSKSLHSTVDAK